MKTFQESGKKHLLITGDRGSGKSTLFMKIKESLLQSGGDLPGITTYLIPQICVMLRENGTGQEKAIGRVKADEKGNFCGMIPVSEGFKELGIPALKCASASKSEWVSIDEIGYLESREAEFQDTIREVFQKKRVLAVLRKQDIPFLNELKNRDDVYVIDLDHFQKKVGCVIMASGMSRRFGTNKLMEAFNGKPLIQKILDSTEGVFEKRVVITRHEEVEELCRKQNVDVILHDLPERNDTVRLGTTWMKDMDGIVFCPSDQPFLKKRTLQKIRNTFSFETCDILRLAHGETRGIPILFDKKYRKELEELPEKCGGSYLVRKYPDKVQYVQVEDERELFDIDTRKDLKYALDFTN